MVYSVRLYDRGHVYHPSLRVYVTLIFIKTILTLAGTGGG